MLLWAGQMSFGYTITSGSIRFTVRRCKYTQVVASDPPMNSGRKERQLAVTDGHTRWNIVRADYALHCESSGSSHCFIYDHNSAGVELMESDDSLRGL